MGLIATGRGQAGTGKKKGRIAVSFCKDYRRGGLFQLAQT
jgi:hypothetical protein